MSGGHSELPESVRRQRRTGSSSDSETDSDDTPTDSASDLPDDLNASRRANDDTDSAASGGLIDELPDDPNAGRRASGGGSSASEESSPGTSSGGLPDDPNAGRRATDQTGTSTQNPDETLPDEGETGLGDNPGSPKAAQKQAVGSQLEKEFIRNNNDITSRDQVDVENVRKTDDGSFTGDIVLTDEGREAVIENQRAAVERMGTTGRRFLQREARVTQERSREAFESDVSRNQFAQRQLARQIEREQGFQEGSIDINPTDTGSIEVGLTMGGRRRELLSAAEEQGVPSENVDIVNRDDGSVGLVLTDSALRRRAANQMTGVGADDLQVTDQREFQEDAGLFAASGEDLPDDTQRVVQFTEEARREQLREQVREEFPNAEDISIVEDGPTMEAEITPESGVSRTIRLGQQFVDDPVGSTVEGTGDIVQGSADAIVSTGEAGFNAVTNPVRTSVSVGEDFVGALEDDVVDPTVDFAGDVGRTADNIASSGLVQGAAAVAVPAAAVEPTPFGELTLGAAAAIGTAAVGTGLAIQRGSEALDADPFVGVSDDGGEVPVGEANQDVTEVGVGEPEQPEIGVVDPSPVSEVEPGEVVLSSEVDVPEEENPSEVGVPGLSTQQAVGEQIEDDEGTEEEDDADELGVPDDPFRRSDNRLFDPSRQFGEQESIVSEVDQNTPGFESEDDIGSGIAGEGRSMFEEPEVSEDELIGGGVRGGPEFRDSETSETAELQRLARERDISASVLAGVLGVSADSDAEARRRLAQRGFMERASEQTSTGVTSTPAQDIPQVFPTPATGTQDGELEAEQEAEGELTEELESVQESVSETAQVSEQQQEQERALKEATSERTVTEQVQLNEVVRNATSEGVAEQNVAVNESLFESRGRGRRGKKRKLPRLPNINFDSPTTEEPAGEAGEFERVFESDVATPSEVLGLGEDS